MPMVASFRDLNVYKRAVAEAHSTPAPDLANVHDEPARVFYDRWGDG